MDDQEDRTTSTICRANKYTAAALHHRPVRVAIRDLGGELPASAVLEGERIKLGESITPRHCEVQVASFDC